MVIMEGETQLYGVELDSKQLHLIVVPLLGTLLKGRIFQCVREGFCFLMDSLLI